jgi:membrane protein implicated in regulation of membrane protease activity
MLGLSQMRGFFTLLVISVLFFVLSSHFGHDDGGGEMDGDVGVTSGDNGPSLLSLRNLFLFGVGFGAAGSVATHLGYSLIVSSIIGVGFGAVVALIGFWFYRTISRQQATTNTDTRNLVGKKATVSTYIPQGRMGQIVTQDEHGGTVYLNARTEADHDIDQGAQVVITEASGGMVIVARPTR